MFIRVTFLTGDDLNEEAPGLLNLDTVESFRKLDNMTYVYYKVNTGNDPGVNVSECIKESPKELIELLVKVQAYVRQEA